MRIETILDDLKKRLYKLNIYELRQVARQMGVHRPTDGKKANVINNILKIVKTEEEPVPIANLGAPPKSDKYDVALVVDLSECRNYFLALKNGSLNDSQEFDGNLYLSDGKAFRKFVCNGFADIDGGEMFIRSDISKKALDDVHVDATVIDRYALKCGDYVEGMAFKKEGVAAGLYLVQKINGIASEERPRRADFSALTPVYPSVNLKFSHPESSLVTKMADIFSPAAFGQRIAITGPSKCGKSTFLKQIAAGISCNYRQTEVIVLLIDERPEEISDYKNKLADCKILYTDIAADSSDHLQALRLAVEHAKRVVECNKDIVILFDGISRLIRAAKGDAVLAKRFLASAINAKEGGSLTLISTMDDGDLATNSEIMGICDTVIRLGGGAVQRKIFPVLDVAETHSYREDMFMPEGDILRESELRNLSFDEIFNILNTEK